MKRDLDNLKHLIKVYGFEELEDTLLQHARPSIRVQTKRVEDENELAIGQSKIGGRPDLPTNMDWVKVISEGKSASLQFLAQIDLADVQPYNVENLLPDRGILYFFGHHRRADKYSEKGRVIYCDGDKSVLERKPFPDDLHTTSYILGEQHRFLPCSLDFVPEVNLLFENYNIDYPNGTTWRDLHALVRATHYTPSSPVIHNYDSTNRLLGVSDLSQMQIECQHIEDTGSPFYDTAEKWIAAKQRKDDWQLLFQISSDKNADMTWSDDGVICFYIKLQDLSAKNFDNICLGFFTP